MVIQRDAKVKVWGWANENEEIRVTFRGKRYRATTGKDGKWSVSLAPLPAGGPYNLVIEGEQQKITIEDILVGDVWLCAGQSNMVHYLELHQDRYRADIDRANHPEIRQFVVPNNPVLIGPARKLSGGKWIKATGDDILKFSVVGYFFALELHKRYRVPVGIINTSVGGTPIEAWTSEEGLNIFPDKVAIIQKNKDTAYVNNVNRRADAIRRTIETHRRGDAGMDGPMPWYDPAYVPDDWNTIAIPGYWEDQGLRDLDGIVWYRREIDVPSSMVGVPVRLNMGRIVDADFVYVNGKLVGNKTYQYPQRRYDIPAGVLKAGKNTIAVRVINYNGRGGFVPDKPYHLTAKGDTLDLTGYWQYRVGKVFEREHSPIESISLIHQPSALFNGMIAPITDYALKGFVWYQGESNVERNPGMYDELLRALIRDWRSQWNRGTLPFLFVQLPNFMEVDYLPSESAWAVLRERQRRTLDVPNTAMAVAIDLGEWNDIHPGNKKPVGERLALAARKVAYGEKDVVHSGPILISAKRSGNKVVLHFNSVGSGLVSRDGQPLKWFTLADEDRHFVPADATIEGDKVVLHSEQIVHPVYVRYAWADNPEQVNFYNAEGLPASPFEAQVEGTDELWFGKSAAVVLTYDDALDVHLDHALPVLDSLGLKATFYLSVNFPGCQNRIEEWRRAARNGHELGNHTWYHPCDGSKPGRSWVSPGNDLSKYSTDDIVREIDMTNLFLKSLDGKTERTFAYPCGDTSTGDGSFVEVIKDRFIALRGVASRLNKVESVNLDDVYCVSADESSADQLISWAEKARAENALLVVLFHGVGGGHSINVPLEKHNEFLIYLQTHRENFWVATMAEAARHVRMRLSAK